MDLTYRKAKLEDVYAIVALLFEDELGQIRESKALELDSRYIDAFFNIDKDPNQYLMVVANECDVVATCHLTIMPSLTFTGSTRMNIEAVRVAEKYRGKKIGHKMFAQVLLYAKEKNVSILQLATNKKRTKAKGFYEKLGFVATHEGMKLLVK